MYKISVKTLKDGGLEVNKSVSHSDSLEAITAVDSIIYDIEDNMGISYRKVIKLIKLARKNIKSREILDNGHINNTNK